MEGVFFAQYMSSLQLLESNNYFELEKALVNRNYQVFDYQEQSNLCVKATVYDTQLIDQHPHKEHLIQVKCKILNNSMNVTLFREFYVQSRTKTLKKIFKDKTYMVLNFQVLVNDQIEEIYSKDYLPFCILSTDDFLNFNELTEEDKYKISVIEKSFQKNQFNKIYLKQFMNEYDLNINFNKRERLLQQLKRNQKIYNVLCVVVKNVKQIEYGSIYLVNVIVNNQLSDNLIKVQLNKRQISNTYNLNQQKSMEMEQDFNQYYNQVFQPGSILLFDQLTQEITSNLDIFYQIFDRNRIFKFKNMQNYKKCFSNVIDQMPLQYLEILNSQTVIDRGSYLFYITLTKIIYIKFNIQNERLNCQAQLIVEDPSSKAIISIFNEELFSFFKINQQQQQILFDITKQFGELKLQDHLQNNQRIPYELREEFSVILKEIFYKYNERLIIAFSQQNQQQDQKLLNINGSIFEENGNYYNIPFLKLIQTINIDYNQQSLIFQQQYENENE